MSKKSKKRRNKNEVRADNKKNIGRAINYYIIGPNKFTFEPPERTSINSLLGNNTPAVRIDEKGFYDPKGKLGQLTSYYIPKNEYKSLTNLFKEFNIPDRLQKDLVWAYLNMVIAGSNSPYGTTFTSNYNYNTSEFCRLLDILKLVREDKCHLSQVSLYFSITAEGKNETQHFKMGDKNELISDGLAIQFLIDILKLYENTKSHSFLQALCMKSDEPPIPKHFGHKNEAKAYQSHYASAIFYYLRPQLYQDLHLLMDDKPKLLAEKKRLDVLYPKKKLYLLIGRMMLQSGLLTMREENPSSEQIADNIRKKINTAPDSPREAPPGKKMK